MTVPTLPQGVLAREPAPVCCAFHATGGDAAEPHGRHFADGWDSEEYNRLVATHIAEPWACVAGGVATAGDVS